MKKLATRLPAVGRLILLGSLWDCGLWAQQPPSSSAPTPSQTSPAQTGPTTTLKVDVNLVNVFVTVTDAQGAPVAGLTKENFLLEEDGHEQKIAVFDKESPLTISLALDIHTT